MNIIAVAWLLELVFAVDRVSDVGRVDRDAAPARREGKPVYRIVHAVLPVNWYLAISPHGLATVSELSVVPPIDTEEPVSPISVIGSHDDETSSLLTICRSEVGARYVSSELLVVARLDELAVVRVEVLDFVVEVGLVECFGQFESERAVLAQLQVGEAARSGWEARSVTICRRSGI